MRLLIKLALLAAVVTIATSALAQSVALKGGLNLSTMLIKDNDDTYSDDFKLNPGFNVGATVDVPVAGIFSLETGALLSTRGFRINEKETSDGYTIEMKETMNLYYLEVPVMAKLTFDVGSVKINGILGPYFGVGLFGNAKLELSGGGETFKDEYAIHWGSDEAEDDLKRLDYGATIGAGVDISGVLLGVTYNYGLANISAYTEDGATTNNRTLAISVGYRFGGK